MADCKQIWRELLNVSKLFFSKQQFIAGLLLINTCPEGVRSRQGIRPINEAPLDCMLRLNTKNAEVGGSQASLECWSN